MAVVRLEPQFHERVWGRTDLAPLFPLVQKPTGEVWFTAEPPLPLLIKFLFTSERLSVQVHPEDDYAFKHHQCPGKTEMWHVLAAEPGATIALGFRETISRERLAESAVSGEIEQLLEWVPVRAGETYLTPAGVVHAIGAGVTICEIQQQSDITYRLYDYNRGRELHLDHGVNVSRLGPHDGRTQPKRLDDGWEVLAECRYFRTEKRAGAAAGTVQRRAPHEAWIVVNGTGTLGGQPVRSGEVWLWTSDGVIDWAPDGHAEVLRTFVPE